MRPFFLISLVAAAAGCSGTTGIMPGTGNDDAQAPAVPGVDAGSDSTDAGSSLGSESGPLKIVSLSSTSKAIIGGTPLATESASTTFIAIVTNKQGLDAIAGGELRDDQANVYGAFGAGAEKGTYTSSVDWTTLQAIAAPVFGTGQGSRKFIARFFDNEGHVAESSISISLACRVDDELWGSCGDGMCFDTRMDGESCASCGAVCPVAKACKASSCTTIGYTPGTGGSDCTAVKALSSTTTCEDICAVHGRKSSGATLWTDSQCKSGVSSLSATVPIRTTSTAAKYVRCTCPSP